MIFNVVLNVKEVIIVINRVFRYFQCHFIFIWPLKIRLPPSSTKVYKIKRDHFLLIKNKKSI